MKLLINGLIKFTCGLVMVGLLIFLPAGTLHFFNGWLLTGLLFVPMLIAGFVMFFKDPAFLARRLDAKEKQAAQKGVLALSGLMFIGGFVIAGLDFRFGWSRIFNLNTKSTPALSRSKKAREWWTQVFTVLSATPCIWQRCCCLP